MRIFLLILFASFPIWAQSELKVLTYNVYAKPDPTNARYTEERMEQICDQLKRGSWDIVYLQEVWTTHYRRSFRKCGFDHIMDIDKTGDNSPEGSLGSGLMILSKHPLKNMKRLVLSRPTFNWRAVTHGEVLVWKSVYLAQVDIKNENSLWVSNTHLTANYCETSDYSDCDSYESVRATQLREAATFIKDHTGFQEVVFGGDLNSGPRPPRADLGWMTLPETLTGFHQANYNPLSTCTSCGSNYFKKKDGGKLDHLFVSSNLLAADGRVVLDQKFATKNESKLINFSDHYGWETTVKWPGMKPKVAIGE